MTNLRQLRASLGNAIVALFAITWLIVFLSQIADVVSGRYITNTGIYVSLSPDETLVVDGLLTENGSNGLQRNDIIIGIGTNKFEDTGRIPRSQSAFRWAFLNAGGHVLIERDGQVIPVAVPLEARPLSWLSVVTAFIFGALGLLVAVFGKPNYGTRRPAMILLLVGILGIGVPHGPSAETVMLNIIVYSVAYGLFFPIFINWLQRLAKPSGERSRLLLPWVLSVHCIFVFSFNWGAPIPPPFALYAYNIMLLFGVTCWFGTVFRIHSRLSKATHQQLNWVLAGTTLTVIGLFSAVAASWILSNNNLLYAGNLAIVFLAVGFTMAILKSDFGDIDRAVSVSLTYAILVVLFALSLEFFVEPLAGFTATYIDLPEEAGQTILIVIIALGAPGLKRLIQPTIKNYFMGAPSGS